MLLFQSRARFDFHELPGITIARISFVVADQHVHADGHVIVSERGLEDGGNARHRHAPGGWSGQASAWCR